MKIEKFCPSVEQCMLMRSSRFLSLFPLRQAATASRESIFFFSKFFKIPFEKFCPSVPWDSPVRHFWVIFAFLDFRVELGFRGRFSTVEPGSRLSGHPVGGRLALTTSHQMLPPKTGFDSLLTTGPVLGFRVDLQPSNRNLRSLDCLSLSCR